MSFITGTQAVSSTWSATTGAPTVTLTNFYVFGLN